MNVTHGIFTEDTDALAFAAYRSDLSGYLWTSKASADLFELTKKGKMGVFSSTVPK